MQIVEEMRIQIKILADLYPEYIGELIIALLEYKEGLHPDPDDLYPAVRDLFLYWTRPDNLSRIFP